MLSQQSEKRNGVLKSFANQLSQQSDGRNVGVNNYLLIVQFHWINRSLRHPLGVASVGTLVGSLDLIVCKWEMTCLQISQNSCANESLFANESRLICKRINIHLQMSQVSFANEFMTQLYSFANELTPHLQTSTHLYMNCDSFANELHLQMICGKFGTYLQMSLILVLICKWGPFAYEE